MSRSVTPVARQVAALIGLVLLLAPLLAALPEEPQTISSTFWSSWLCAAALEGTALAALAVLRGDRTLGVRVTRAEAAFLVLLGLAFLSIPARMAVEHGTGYFGPMLHGWMLLATNFALFALARRVAVHRTLALGLLLAAIAGAAIVADRGVQEYLPSVRAGHPEVRVFATSTPDFLAGYLVMLLPTTLAVLLSLLGTRALSPLVRGAGGLILALVLLFQAVTLLGTSSRFGSLVSLPFGLVVFASGLSFAVRRGYPLARWLRLAGLGLAALGLLVGVAFARPVLARLHNLHDNSTAFRVWTWRGSVRMAAANPVLGTGVGIWSDQYPRYALTGFTRLAHSGYLQMADECGIPALLALLATLGLLGVSLVRGLYVRPTEIVPASLPAPAPPIKATRQSRRRAAPQPVPPTGPARADLLPADSRLLQCGLLAALAEGVTQNLIDSDWSVFFLGATFWTLAGLASGLAAPPSDIAPDTIADTPKVVPARLPLVAVGLVAAVFAVYAATQGVAAGYASQAQDLLDADPAGAARTLDVARQWDPLSPRYPYDQGYRAYYAHLGDLPDAEASLRMAVSLAPNSSSQRRLGEVLQRQGRRADALAAYQAGLHADPNSLDLLLALARLSPPPASLGYYQRVSDLELTPVGTVRALGETTETKFALADTAVADALARTGPARATTLYARAAHVLERFADEGGSTDPQRQGMNGGRADPRLDSDLRGLYGHVLDSWISLAPPAGRDKLRRRRVQYTRIFDSVLAQSSQTNNR